jgi:cell division protein FtsA
LAQFIENSGLKDKIGAGVVLTGGFSQMEGIRELAVATFGSVPVRLAKPKEMNGLFDNLRSPEYSSAVGLVLYAASAYTLYEIDVNKRVRHSNEMLTEHTNINLTEEHDIPTPQLRTEKKEGMGTISLKKEKKSDEAGAFSKFWNWATQLF